MKDIFKVAMLQMERSSDINNNIKKGIKFCKNAKLMGRILLYFQKCGATDMKYYLEVF